MIGALPYTLPRHKNDRLRKKWGPLVAEHFKEGEFDRLMGARTLEGKDQVNRIRANQMLQLCEATSLQTRYVLESIAPQIGHSAESLRQAMTNESGPLDSTHNQLSDITSFITQMLHMSLDVFPRLLANELVSIQPLNSPSGYIFFLTGHDQTGRNLSDLDLFDQDYTADPGEGQQISKVKTRLSKQLVEAEYRKLMWESSHEVMVALRSQFGLSIEAINDGLVAKEMAWEVDRVIIDRLYDFADQDYTFDPTDGGSYDSKTEQDQKAYDEKFLSRTMANVETDMQSRIFVKPNWALAGTEAIRFLKRLRKFETRKEGEMGDIITSNGSIIYSGKVDEMKIWHDPQLDPCSMLVGYTQNMDPFYAGFIWSPFGLASIMTAAWTDPDFLLTKKARALAFATKGIRAEQYARIHFRPCS
jgi:hypothetical protein